MNRSRWLIAATLLVILGAIAAVLATRGDDDEPGRHQLTVVVGSLPKRDPDTCTAAGESGQRFVNGRVTVTPARGQAAHSGPLAGDGVVETSNAPEFGPSEGCFWSVTLDVPIADSYTITAELPRGETLTKAASEADLEQLDWRIRVTKSFF